MSLSTVYLGLGSNIDREAHLCAGLDALASFLQGMHCSPVFESQAVGIKSGPFYNLVVTGLSVAVGVVIGTIEILGLFSNALNAHGAFWSWASGIDLNSLGFAIVGLFVATWLVSVAIWKFGRIEEKWAPVRSHSGIIKQQMGE